MLEPREGKADRRSNCVERKTSLPSPLSIAITTSTSASQTHSFFLSSYPNRGEDTEELLSSKENRNRAVHQTTTAPPPPTGRTTTSNGRRLGDGGRGGRALLADHGGVGPAVRLPGRAPARPLPGAARGRPPVVRRRVRPLPRRRPAAFLPRPRLARPGLPVARLRRQPLRHPRAPPLVGHHLPHGRGLHAHLLVCDTR